MGRGAWIVGTVLLGAGALAAWWTWSGTSPGQWDPVSVPIALVALAVAVIQLAQAARTQRGEDLDVIAAAGRLATAVMDLETRERHRLLGRSDRVIAVEYDLRPAAAHEAAGALARGTLAQVLGYYSRLRPARLVITGEPGAGKTVLAIELVIRLLECRDPAGPVPVRISAASLDTARPTETAVADWLVDHLSSAFKHLPRRTARQLVTARMVVPVLDGLDEMDVAGGPVYSSRAGQVIRACNAYLAGTRKAALVITCRTAQYRALQKAREWVHDSALVQIRPVGLPQARAFLTHRAGDPERWRPVLEAMRRGRNRPLARALSTPWRLTLAATVYERRHATTGAYLREPGELTDAALDTERKLRDHLIGLFIPAAAELHGRRRSARRVHLWLATLARHLEENTTTRSVRTVDGRPLSGTDLLLIELWPLAGHRRPRVVAALLFSTIWLIGLAGLVWVWEDGRWGHSWADGTAAAEFVALLGMGCVSSYLSRLGRTNRSALRGVPSGAGIGRRVYDRVARLSDLLANGVSGTDPRTGVRANLAFLPVFFVVGSLEGLREWHTGNVPLAVVLPPVGLMVGVIFGATGWQYVGLLACTRRWSGRRLPWRLGRFLNWCCGAGLMRAVGGAYQFRHRELQEYLARRPRP